MFASLGIAFRIARLAYQARRNGVSNANVARLVAHAILACEAAERGAISARLHVGAARNILRRA